MKRRLLLLLATVLIVGLVLGSWLVRAESAPPAIYRLEAAGLRASGASSGGGYRLLLPGSPTGTGTPCCCTYLPCLRR